jgi:hypothetical protein
MLDQSETTIEFLAGRNFHRFGLLRERFTPDFATSLDPAAHPMFYTHYADFTEYVAYVLIVLGVPTIPGQVLVGIFIGVAGLYAMTRAVAVHVGSAAAALCVLFVSVIDYASVVVAMLNTHKNWAWLVVFVPLWAFRRYSDTSRPMFLWTAVAGYFLLGYYDYGLMIYVALVLALLHAFGFYRRCSWKDVAAVVVGGGGAACALHSLFVVAALGPSVFWRDVQMTLQNRVAGTVARKELVRFYQSNGLVLWGYDEPGTLATNLATTITRITGIFGPWYSAIVAVIAAGSVARASVGTRRHRARSAGSAGVDTKLTMARFIAAFAIPLFAMFPIFHVQMTVLYGSAWAPLYIFPFSIAGGLALLLCARAAAAARRSGSLFGALGAGAWVILIPLAVVSAQYNHFTGDVPIKEFPGHDALAKYQGRSFATNYQAAYVSYFTNEWAVYHGMANVKPGSFPPIDEYSRSYVFERDIATNPSKYDHPEFVFMMWADHPGLAASFPLVEHGTNYWIYDVRGGSHATGR